ncbi:MAG: type II toxin-antitoxin system VapC family toxin [Solirubrobacterales bacterium]|nr:type II toxin-antitoxin system VapC family toxin [Solirubrobacterales bacterium]
MRLLDANILLYAVDESSPRFRSAHPWVESVIGGQETVALPWVVLLAFLRLTTKAQVMTSPLTPTEALEIIDTWLARPNTVVVHPTDRHASVLRELLAPLGSAGNLVTDAHLAALAIEHGAELNSCDADFSRFAGLRWRDPLSSG